MKYTIKIIGLYLIYFCFLSNCYSNSQKPEKGKSFVFLSGQDTPEMIIKKAAHVIPSSQQLEWQKLEYTAFVHFGLYTFQLREMPASPDLFNPVGLDCRQWAKTFKDAGMKGVILTAKHHEGFCLWPSQYTDYSVKSSKWRNGMGDVVKELSNACREYGLKFGIYISPWDKHNPDYGTPKYDEYFKNQLTELLTNYGDIFEVWFDGYYGGTKGKKQQYDWKGYVDLTRKLQPNAAIAIMGPDIRWVGTETGYGRDTEWSVVPVGEQDLKLVKTFDRFLVQENIQNGQRIEGFKLEAWENGHWVEKLNGTTIGYKRILRFPVTRSSKVRLTIIDARDCPEIKYVGLYKSPNGV